ncbi:hypothetical protein T05_8891 [Trichinella murrelli]|uniref:Uncharacterized protein n=1 Tax=Trichinella murrelli TaxID=144512 RepID=A0A0V0SXN1_9BILA|nr:hypothetical protein T05_14475 [Trichinella murrelli]KRX31516.1 hypothetical protein T05_8891 [Trichinella murrelli]
MITILDVFSSYQIYSYFTIHLNTEKSKKLQILKKQ